MNGVNKAIIVGRVGQDPRITTFQNGGKTAQFSLATTERGYKTRDGRDVPERTEWHNIVCYGSIADVVSQYVRKGASVYVEGKIRTRKYTDQQNIERMITEIYVDEMQLLDKKQDGQQQNASVASPEASQQRSVSSADNSSSQTQTSQGEQKNDDLPF